MARPAKPPLIYRPPVGLFIPQTGMGSQETRFANRDYSKGLEKMPPNMKLPGSTPKRSGSSAKSGAAKTFSKFPEYTADPWDEKIKAIRAAKAAERAKMADSRPFKPTAADPDYRTTKGLNPAFAAKYTSSITFRASNLRRG